MRRGGLSSPCLRVFLRHQTPSLSRPFSSSFPLRMSDLPSPCVPVFLGILPPFLSRSSSSSFALTRDALSSRYVRVFLRHRPPSLSRLSSSFFTQGDTSPLPEAELGLVFRCSSRPRGSSFYGGFDAPSGTSSDDGLGTWRPILQKLGPLPAQMGGMQLATWIHLTSRNLSCFHRAQFSQSRLLRESAPRRRTPHLPGGGCRYPAPTSKPPSTGPPSIPSDFSCVPNMCFYLKMFRSHIVASIRSCRG